MQPLFRSAGEPVRSSGRFAVIVLVAGSLAWSCSGDRKPAASAVPSAGTAGSAYADPKVEEIVIARVGDEKLRVRDLDTKTRVQFPQFKDLKGADAVHQKWEILLSMFDQALWVYAGHKHGIDRDPEFLQNVELSRRHLLSNLTVRRLVHDASRPTEAEARRYYEENDDQFRQAARCVVDHVLLTSRAEAEAVRRRILAGEDFAQMVQRYSKDDASIHSGGNIGVVGASTVVRGFEEVIPALNQAIFATPEGGISEPVETARGWSIFRVRGKTAATTISFEEAREGIEKKMQSKRAQELFATLLDEVRRESRAVIDTAGFQEYAFSVLTPEEIFQMSEADPRPEQRLGWMLALAKRDPQGPRAAQALFLAGFAYAEDLKDYPRAREQFQAILDRYPENELAPSARWMLDHMEAGVEELPEFGDIKRRAYER